MVAWHVQEGYRRTNEQTNKMNLRGKRSLDFLRPFSSKRPEVERARDDSVGMGIEKKLLKIVYFIEK